MRSRSLLLAVGALLALPAAAQAHISLHPNTIPAGAFATIDVRMPGEQEGAHVTRLDILFPPGFTGVEVENVPGWSVSLLHQKVSPPIQTDEGPVDEQVAQAIWTWTGPLGEVADNQFIEFPLSVAVPGNLAGQSLQFKAVQTYSNGQVVHWIDPALGAEHPAPRINVTARGGLVEEVAGAEAGPEAGSGGGAGARAPAASAGGKGASEGLALAGLIVGALGLLAGAGALLAIRRTGAAGRT